MVGQTVIALHLVQFGGGWGAKMVGGGLIDDMNFSRIEAVGGDDIPLAGL